MLRETGLHAVQRRKDPGDITEREGLPGSSGCNHLCELVNRLN